ncbi:MAG: hypothetical protein JW782_04410 [Candidatus Saganbacteria bacterium]|nr:hypothetical protein [Candidatus Saganbacteria bacterium]
MLTETEIKRFLAMPGMTKGVVFQTDAEYIRKKFGEAGLAQLEARVKELGVPIDYRKAKAMEWLPLGLRVISLLAIKELFSLSNEDIKAMGNTAPKLSFLIKLLLKSFISIRATFAKAPEMWQRHYSIGRVFSDYHETDRCVAVTITGIELPPIMVGYLEGYFQRIAQYSLGPNVRCDRDPSLEKGEVKHGFRVSW